MAGAAAVPALSRSTAATTDRCSVAVRAVWVHGFLGPPCCDPLGSAFGNLIPNKGLHFAQQLPGYGIDVAACVSFVEAGRTHGCGAGDASVAVVDVTRARASAKFADSGFAKWLDSSSTFSSWASDKNYQENWVVVYDSGLSQLAIIAGAVKVCINEYFEKRKTTVLPMVVHAHSMGGLVMADALQRTVFWVDRRFEPARAVGTTALEKWDVRGLFAHNAPWCGLSAGTLALVEQITSGTPAFSAVRAAVSMLFERSASFLEAVKPTESTGQSEDYRPTVLALAAAGVSVHLVSWIPGTDSLLPAETTTIAEVAGTAIVPEGLVDSTEVPGRRNIFNHYWPCSIPVPALTGAASVAGVAQQLLAVEIAEDIIAHATGRSSLLSQVPGAQERVCALVRQLVEPSFT